jgi:hypothetical protein
MRKSIYSAGAVVASVAMLAVGAPTASHAMTIDEANVCWLNGADGTTDLEAVLDGTAAKFASLDSGDCKAWDVTPGQYKFTVEDVKEFLDAITAECAHYGRIGGGHYTDLDGSGDASGPKNEWQTNPRVVVKIKRQGDFYKAWNLGALINGEITTNIKKDRRTSILVNYYCSATPDSLI